MHLLASVTVMIDHSKVTYDLFFNSQTIRYFFQPTCLLTAWYLAPSFSLFKKESSWITQGLRDEAIKSQAIDKIRQLHSLQDLPADLRDICLKVTP